LVEQINTRYPQRQGQQHYCRGSHRAKPPWISQRKALENRQALTFIEEIHSSIEATAAWIIIEYCMFRREIRALVSLAISKGMR